MLQLIKCAVQLLFTAAAHLKSTHNGSRQATDKGPNGQGCAGRQLYGRLAAAGKKMMQSHSIQIRLASAGIHLQ